MVPLRRRAVVLAGLVLASACAGPNLWTDGTSVSTGTTSRGRLRRPAKLPLEGAGFAVPARWSERGFQYGVAELVEAIQRAARRVSGRAKKVVLGVADLSPQRGGKSMWHGSHQSGRDVDLIFYSVDPEGRPMAPPEHDMIRYDPDGKPYVRRNATYSELGWEQRRFDTARNWQLVESLLTDAEIRVQWIFVSEGLESRLLEHAARKQRPAWLIEYARTVLYNPADAPPHDDHFHVRIYCSRADRFHGCVDRGPVWQHEKKRYKYGGPERYDPYQWRMLTKLPLIAGPG
jgi:penicillin-insensitive murein DD-endopeptidase